MCSTFWQAFLFSIRSTRLDFFASSASQGVSAARERESESELQLSKRRRRPWPRKNKSASDDVHAPHERLLPRAPSFRRRSLDDLEIGKKKRNRQSGEDCPGIVAIGLSSWMPKGEANEREKSEANCQNGTAEDAKRGWQRSSEHPALSSSA